MKVRISELRQDEELISIRKVNSFTVSRYRQAMRSGAKFPPIVIDEKTNIIVSGNHRYESYLQEFGDSYEVEVIKRTYRNRAEVLKDFAAENVAHGRPFEGFEMRQIIQKMANENVSAEECSRIFNIPVQRIMKYADMSVIVVGKNKTHEVKSVKRGLEHMSGKKISEEIYEEHKQKDHGIPCFNQANQLRRWIENDLINKEDEKGISELRLLMDALNKFFG